MTKQIEQLKIGPEYRMTLRDEFDDAGGRDRTLELRASVSPSDNMLIIGAEGFGEKTMDDGHPIAIELYEGKWRVLIWSDINNEDPTHVIDMSGALESNRKEA